MARINVEPNLFTRGEWLALVVATGSPDTALGALVRIWTVAQRFWFPDRKPIPLDVWNRERLNQAVIDCGLAESRTDGIYVRGSEEQFAWLFEASAKGKKSAAARKAKFGSAQPGAKKVKASRKKPEPDSNTARTAVEPAPNRPEALPLYSSSLLSSPSPSSSSSQVTVSGETASDSGKAGYVIRLYAEEWKAAHGSSPPITGKDAGIAKRLATTIPLGRLENYLEAYFAMPDAWIVKARHPLELFESKLKEIAAFADSGKFTTRKQAAQADSTVGTASLLSQIRSGSFK